MPEIAIQRPLHPSSRTNRQSMRPYILFKPGVDAVAFDGGAELAVLDARDHRAGHPEPVDDPGELFRLRPQVPEPNVRIIDTKIQCVCTLGRLDRKWRVADDDWQSVSEQGAIRWP